jgi:hypothetical protein
MRAILATGYLFSSLLAPPEIGKQARRCGEPAVSRCSALAEAAQVMKFVQPLARARHRASYTALTEDLEALSCPTSLPRRLWERGVTYGDPNALADGFPWDGLEWPELLPEQRPVVTHLQPPDWLDLLPERVLRPAYLSETLSRSVPGTVRPLEEFRARLQAGDFPP